MPVTPDYTVRRVLLDWTLTPEQAALIVRSDERPFALIGRWAGGGAVIGSEPVRVATPADDPFALLDELPAGDQPSGAVAGGWFGYLGYQLGARIEPVGAPPPTGNHLPPFELAFYDHVLHLDRDHRWWFEALRSEVRADALRARLGELNERARTPPQPRNFTTQPWQATPSPAGHERAVASARRRIHEGDLFQANICTRLRSTIHAGEAIDVFAIAVGRLRPDRAAFLSGPWGAVASLSPELFLERHGNGVRSAPIKGTTGRPADPNAAARQREALERSPKDRAENVMIVDLVRNDLGRVAIPGSISVPARNEVRPHAGVWHLVSEVTGTVASDMGNAELVRAAFPPGSVTGAPKVAALNVIAELESTARNVYTGAIGFASPVAGLELNVAIRTFEFRGTAVWLGVGGGIVADSDPAAEAAECATKAAPLLAAIGAELAPNPRPQSAPARAPVPARVGPRPTPRPDPAAGVFETLLVSDGRPVDLQQHLARLARSVHELYGQSLPPALHRLATTEAAATTAEQARMRIDARPNLTGIDIGFELTPVPKRDPPPHLQPVTIPGGIGPHKWIDRRLLDTLCATVAPGTEPLLCDLDGYVLETPRANVFIVNPHGAVLTPPADGRILAGVTRARALARAAELGLETAIRPIILSELAAAPELFLTGSLAGVEPALLEHEPTRATRVSDRLRTNLYETPRRAILR